MVTEFGIQLLFADIIARSNGFYWILSVLRLRPGLWSIRKFNIYENTVTWIVDYIPRNINWSPKLIRTFWWFDHKESRVYYGNSSFGELEFFSVHAAMVTTWIHKDTFWAFVSDWTCALYVAWNFFYSDSSAEIYQFTGFAAFLLSVKLNIFPTNRIIRRLLLALTNRLLMT